MRPTYNRVKRVHARSEGPNPSGPVHIMLSSSRMKKKILVEKRKFDAVLSALLKAKPIPARKIKTTGKRGPKTPMFAPKQDS
jgi:hypothetical protein